MDGYADSRRYGKVMNDRQYETKSNTQATQLPLFHFKDIHYLLTHNIALRLSDRSTELNNGGTGDAISLSNIGGAKDTVEFVSMASLLLHHAGSDNDALQQYRARLTKIFRQYVDPNRNTLDWAPNLMLCYAHLLEIGNKNIPSTIQEYRLPHDEEHYLIDIFKKCSGEALLPICLFDPTLPYFGDLPSLRLHLTKDFNQLLEKRLVYNRRFYSDDTMFYLLLVTTDQKSSYDSSVYPLGKIGEFDFDADNIQSHFKFIRHPDNHLSEIWTWLKEQCEAPSLAPIKIISPDPATEQPSTWQKCVKFCQENPLSVGVVLAGVGLFASKKIMDYQQGYQRDHLFEP